MNSVAYGCSGERPGGKKALELKRCVDGRRRKRMDLLQRNWLPKTREIVEEQYLDHPYALASVAFDRLRILYSGTNLRVAGGERSSL